MVTFTNIIALGTHTSEYVKREKILIYYYYYYYYWKHWLCVYVCREKTICKM